MLSIVSTPIGNPDDISPRALRVLREAVTVICEERRAGARLLAQFQIQKELIELNEHTEGARVPELVARLKGGEHLALISDHGTPLITDPGARLVQQAIAEKIPVTAIPGASSLLAALVVSGLATERFRFVGLLPAKKDARRAELQRLQADRDPLIILDTPYRLAGLLADLRAVFGSARRAAVACNLTMPAENVVRGTLAEIDEQFKTNPFKGEFVIVVAGRAIHNS
ncbi:MAG: 16S rRNA (cytidine(1402)-2'-O)-methyltransferase [Chloroflexi bacterium]|nr:16S rRNA (cytidine(1402)-2'-O)-methyltransferase [Chloroflexota bacterium]